MNTHPSPLCLSKLTWPSWLLLRKYKKPNHQNESPVNTGDGNAPEEDYLQSPGAPWETLLWRSVGQEALSLAALREHLFSDVLTFARALACNSAGPVCWRRDTSQGTRSRVCKPVWALRSYWKWRLTWELWRSRLRNWPFPSKTGGKTHLFQSQGSRFQ